MANNTNKLNDIWGKVLDFFGYRDLPNPWLSNTTIDEPLTLYVETTGNDLNPGTQDRPFKTIQAAIDSLVGKQIVANVTIRVGAGEFDGVYIGGLSFRENTTNQQGPALMIQGADMALVDVGGAGTNTGSDV